MSNTIPLLILGLKGRREIYFSFGSNVSEKKYRRIQLENIFHNTLAIFHNPISRTMALLVSPVSCTGRSSWATTKEVTSILKK